MQSIYFQCISVPARYVEQAFQYYEDSLLPSLAFTERITFEDGFAILQRTHAYINTFLEIRDDCVACHCESIFELLTLACCRFRRGEDTVEQAVRNNLVIRTCLRAILQFMDERDDDPEMSVFMARLLSIRDEYECSPFLKLLPRQPLSA